MTPSFTTRMSIGGLAALLALASATARAQDGAALAVPAPPAPAVAPPAAPPVAQPMLQPAAPVYATAPYVPSYAPQRERPIVGYRTQTRANPALWGTGLALFLAGYVLDFAVLTPLANAISNDRDGADEEDAWAWSLLPIAGPIIQLGIGAPHPAIPIATGLMQLGGVVLFIWGLTDEQTLRVPVRAGDPEDPNLPTLGFDARPLPGGGELRVDLAF